MRALLALSVLTLCSCSSPKPPAEAASPTPPQVAPTPTPAPAPPPQAAPVPGEPAAAGPPAAGPSAKVAPDIQPGPLASVQTKLSGCLAAPRTASSGLTFPAKGEPAQPVQTRVTEKGLVVEHQIVHSCCMAAEVDARNKDGLVRMHEKLTGTPCGCTCASTIDTAIGLGPGKYELVVETENEEGKTHEVARKKVEVAGPSVFIGHVGK